MNIIIRYGQIIRRLVIVHRPACRECHITLHRPTSRPIINAEEPPAIRLLPAIGMYWLPLAAGGFLASHWHAGYGQPLATSAIDRSGHATIHYQRATRLVMSYATHGGYRLGAAGCRTGTGHRQQKAGRIQSRHTPAGNAPLPYNTLSVRLGHRTYRRFGHTRASQSVAAGEGHLLFRLPAAGHGGNTSLCNMRHYHWPLAAT